jgi:hypothetical protein
MRACPPVRDVASLLQGSSTGADDVALDGLASALHPDRQTDAQQREVKTGLMQQANQAYARSDLLALLALQRYSCASGRPMPGTWPSVKGRIIIEGRRARNDCGSPHGHRLQRRGASLIGGLPARLARMLHVVPYSHVRHG